MSTGAGNNSELPPVTIRAILYGRYKRPAVEVDYGRGGTLYFYEEYDLGDDAMDLLHRIQFAHDAGRKLVFEQLTKEQRAKLRRQKD
jgi:hypothetical protein